MRPQQEMVAGKSDDIEIYDDKDLVDKDHHKQNIKKSKKEKEEKKYLTYKLPVDGEDVMRVANIQPGPKVKEYLDRLLKFAFANPDYCEREDILNYLRYLVKENE